MKPFKGALLADGIALTRCAVPDVRSDYARLRGLGVRFTQDPVDLGAGRHGDIRGHLAGT